MMRKRKDILSSSPSTYISSRSSKLRRPQSVWNSKWLSVIQCIIILALSVTVFYYRSEASKSSVTTEAVIAKYSEQLGLLKEQQTEIKQLRSEQQKSALDQVAKDRSASVVAAPPHDKDKDEWNENDLKWIKDVKENDYKSLVLQYGAAPIRVLIETKFGDITLEMAPTESMPHTIRYFLTLVENDYWNGCHFFRNAGHVIQANCHRRNRENEFSREGKAGSISFQEYDESLPYLHQKYSIGMAGRPGGPDFYVNLLDNKRNHGPGGQGPKPDPCFANIVEGQDVVDEIHRLEHDGSTMRVLKEWVEFERVTVIQD